jgi:hypothetical protein
MMHVIVGKDGSVLKLVIISEAARPCMLHTEATHHNGMGSTRKAGTWLEKKRALFAPSTNPPTRPFPFPYRPQKVIIKR